MAGGGKGGSSAPAAPDPAATSAAQAQANMGTARVQQRLNMIDQKNPWYSVSYTDMGDRSRNPDGTPMNRSAAPAPAAGAGAAGVAQPPGGQDPNSRGGDVMGPTARVTGGGNGYTGPLTWDDQGNPSIPSGSQGQGGAAAAPQRAGAYDPNDPLAGEQAYYNQDRWRQNITLDPAEQALLDQSRGIRQQTGNLGSSLLSIGQNQTGAIQSALNKPIDFAGLPEMVKGIDQSSLPQLNRQDISSAGAGQIQDRIADAGAITRQAPDAGPVPTSASAGDIQRGVTGVGGPQRNVGPQDWSSDRQKVEDALYGKAASRLDPRFSSEQRALEQRLADQGIPVGSEAYSRAMDDFNRSKTDAYGQATSDAILAGGNEQSRLANLDFTKFGLENQAQGQEFEQGMANANLNNAGQAQQFGQDLTSQGQRFNQGLAGATFANQAQQQQFGQNAAGAEFGNNAQNQRFQQNATSSAQNFGQSSAAREQMVNELLANAGLASSARAQGINEREMQRQQPINDFSRLLQAFGAVA